MAIKVYAVKKWGFLAAFLCCAALELFAAPPRIVIRNSTGFNVREVYVSPSSSSDWGEDCLGGKTLADKGEIAVELPLPLSKQKVYDIMLIDVEGDCYSRMDESLSEGGRVVITFDDYDEEPPYTEDEEEGPTAL